MRRAIALASVLSLSVTGLVAAGSAAASAPSATTGAATNVTASAATVSGTVNPNGESATYSFQFGTTTGYGSQTSPVSAGSGTAAVSVSRTITGLKSGTSYHYRLIATNGSGTTVGNDLTFTTSGSAPPPPKAPPPTATTRGADAIGSRGATVHGTVNPSGATTTFYFEFGLTSAYGFRSTPRSLSAGTSARSVSATLTGLQSAATYHYRLVATSVNGTSLGGDRRFTTATSSRVRGLPALTVRVRPARDSVPPFRFAVRGQLIRPAGVTRSRGCRGWVTVRIKSRRKTVGLRRARVTRGCRFRTRVRVSGRRTRTLRVLVRFGGNAALLPRSVPALKVDAG